MYKAWGTGGVEVYNWGVGGVKLYRAWVIGELVEDLRRVEEMGGMVGKAWERPRRRGTFSCSNDEHTE